MHPKRKIFSDPFTDQVRNFCNSLSKCRIDANFLLLKEFGKQHRRIMESIMDSWFIKDRCPKHQLANFVRTLDNYVRNGYEILQKLIPLPPNLYAIGAQPTSNF